MAPPVALALFGNLGMLEMVLILVVAVLVFGKDLPQAASKAYLQARKLRNAVDDLRREIRDGFERRILEATMGAELVKILTPATAFDLLRNDKLRDFLGATMYQGKPLLERLGGWLKTAEVFRGKEMACYHREWAYFSRRYQVTCADYIEAKPGIPPTPRHVEDVIALIRERRIPVLFASNYFNRNQIQQVAAKTGATAVVVPENTEGAPGVETYFALMDTWVNGLADGFRKGVH